MVTGVVKIAVCDDELLAVRDLSGLISMYADENRLQIQQSEYLSGEQFLADFKEQGKAFDILFLDIKMRKINGIETAKIVRQANETIIIIFVSALHEYVFDAFDVEAKGFIVKPADKEKMYGMLDKSFLKLEKYRRCSLNLYHGGEMERVPFERIYYCEVQDHSVFVYEREKFNKYQGKIDDLEKVLNNDFFRCHRSYIVNLRFVQSYRERIIFMQSGEKIPVAGRREKEFMKALLHFQREEVR